MFQIIGGPLTDSCFFGVGYKISVGKKEATIYRYPVGKEATSQTLPLKLPPLPSQMPITDALNKERAVKWLLQHGYVPSDTGTQVALIQEQSSDQDRHVEAIVRTCGSLIKIIDKFNRRYKENNLRDPELNAAEYQEWFYIQSNDDARFSFKIELVLLVLEECRQALRRKEWQRVNDCLVSLCKIVPQSYGVKELYADYLRSKESASLYLELSGNRSEEEKVLFLEKAIRHDPENPELVSLIAEAPCSEERALHCYVTAYLACSDRESKVACGYARSAIRINKGIQDGLIGGLLSPRDAKEKKAPLEQSWVSVSTLSAPGSPATPKSPRLGLGRTSQGTKPPVAKNVEQPKAENTINQEKNEKKMAFLANPRDWSKLELLLWDYDHPQNDLLQHPRSHYLKAEYSARRLLEEIGIEYRKKLDDVANPMTKEQKRVYQEKLYKIGLAQARAVEGQDRFDHAQRLYFTLAEKNLTLDKDRAVHCLLEIVRIAKKYGYGAFAPQEKKILYLLFLTCNGNSDFDEAVCQLMSSIQPIKSPRVADDVATESSSQNHGGEWAWFSIYTPKYVAVAFTPSRKLLFTKKSVEVFLPGCETPSVYPLQFPPDLSDEMTLVGAAKVRSLLSRGYQPRVMGAYVTFTPLKEPFVEEEYRARVEQIRGLEECAASLKEGAWATACAHLYAASHKSEEIGLLFGQLLLQMNKPELALQWFEKMGEVKGDCRASFLESATIAAAKAKSPDAERWYKQLRSHRQIMQAPDASIQLLTLHGYLYFACHDRSKEETMRIFKNKAENGSDPLLAAWTKGEKEPIFTEGEWKESFDKLFSGANIALEEPQEPRELDYYLRKAQSARGKLIVEGVLCNNSICDAFSSLGLYYLEQALALASSYTTDQAVAVYKAIGEKLQTKKEKEARAAQFLLCIHAVFFFKNRDIRHAESFLMRARELNPDSLLVVMATLALDPYDTALYDHLVAICTSEERLYEYLDMQSKGVFYILSSLEADIKAECEALLQKIDRRKTMSAVDALVDKKHFQDAERRLAPCGNSKAVCKRAFIVARLRNRPFGMSSALTALTELYKKDAEKVSRMTRLYDTYCPQSEIKMLKQLLRSGQRDRVAQLHFEAAFSLFREGKNQEAIYRLQALTELKEYVNFDVEETFILLLLHGLLAVDVVDELTHQFESLTIVK